MENSVNTTTKSSISNRTIFLIILAAIVVWFLSSYVNIRLNYKPLFDWWDQNGGDEYKDKFNMFTLVSANYSTILYYLSKLSGGPLNQLNIVQLRFIVAQLLPYTRYVQNGVQNGTVIPKSLCKSILIESGDNDQTFNNFYATYKRKGNNLLEGSSLKYTRSGPQTNSKNLTYYTYSLGDTDSSGQYGVYPQSTTDTDSWTGLILEWLGPKWCIMYDDKQSIFNLVTIENAGSGDFDTWYGKDGLGRADNFLVRMGILPDSALVVYFVNNKYSTGGMKIDAQAFQNLVQPTSSSVAGGWLGFLNGSTSSDYDDYVNVIHAQVDFNPPTPPTCTQQNTTKGILTGASSAVSLGAMMFMMPWGPAMIGVALAALVVGGISGYQAGAGTC